MASFNTASVRSPRTSSLSRPCAPTPFISTAVTTTSPSECFRTSNGVISTNGTGLVTTPAACIPKFLLIPSSFFEYLKTSGYFASKALHTAKSLKESSIVWLARSSPLDLSIMLLVTSFTAAYGTSKTLETSFKHWLPESLPTVAICETLSSPYLSRRYCIISCLLTSSKSISISGISTRAGLMNLSNKRACSTGSTEVIPKRNAINEPAAEPRPGPHIISCFLAQLYMSLTKRK